jgi:hypothetical protein
VVRGPAGARNRAAARTARRWLIPANERIHGVSENFNRPVPPFQSPPDPVLRLLRCAREPLLVPRLDSIHPSRVVAAVSIEVVRNASQGAARCRITPGSAWPAAWFGWVKMGRRESTARQRVARLTPTTQRPCR